MRLAMEWLTPLHLRLAQRHSDVRSFSRSIAIYWRSWGRALGCCAKLWALPLDGTA